MLAIVCTAPGWLRRRLLLLAGFALLHAATANAQSADLIDPFRPDTAAVAVADAGDADLNALEFSGVASIMDERSFNFTDTRTRKNFWVAMSATENGITVESYDEQAEQVVVRRGARTRPISLRKTVLVALPAGAQVQRPNPMPVSTPVTTAAAAPALGTGVDEIKNPKSPAEIKQAEYEARMLVSDLLDISMQERARQKALRDAQARGQSAPATPPPVRR